jgi:hypothetical protein
MTTFTEAIDQMFALFHTAWDSGSTPIVGSVPAVHWPGVEPKQPPGKSDFWARISTQHVDDTLASHRSGDLPEHKQRYTVSGLLFIQVFGPANDSEAMDKARRLAMVARDAFRGVETSGNVWFRDSRINELPSEEDWYRFNVIVEFEYDDFI